MRGSNEMIRSILCKHKAMKVSQTNILFLSLRLSLFYEAGVGYYYFRTLV